MTAILADEFSSRGNSVFYLATSNAVSEMTSKCKYPQYFINCADVDASRKLHTLLDYREIDIIICQFITNEILSLLETAVGKAKIITVIHSRPFPYCGVEKMVETLLKPRSTREKIMKKLGLRVNTSYLNLRRENERRLYLRAAEISDKIMVTTESHIDRVLKYVPDIKREKLDYVNNPNSFIAPEKEPHNKENLILWIGKLIDPQKNVKGFIDVWNIFHATHPDWNAIIVGDGPQREEYIQHALKTRCSNLKFIGNVEDVTVYYSKAKFLCMTSLHEGWPMVLAEAMSYRCIPAIFNSFEAASDIITDGEDGILATPFDARELAQRIGEVADRKHRRRAMGTAAREAIRRFEASKIAPVWIKKMEELIS